MASEAASSLPGPTGEQKRTRDKEKKLLLKDRKLQLKNVFLVMTAQEELWHRRRGGCIRVHKVCSRWESLDGHLCGIGFKTA